MPADSLSYTKPPGDCDYSGMHDGGPLVEPKEGNGPVTRLIAAVMAAKDYNDAYLTEIIEKEKADKQRRQQEESRRRPEKKKARKSPAEHADETPCAV